MTLQLNDDLINFFSDIIIEFRWNDKFYIDFMDLFPLLKKGITTKNIYYKVIAAYGLRYRFISSDDIIKGVKEKIIIKIYKKYIKYIEYIKNIEKYKLSDTTFSIYLLAKTCSVHETINTDINDDLLNESSLANSLLATFELSSNLLSYDLLKLLCNFNNTSILSKIMNEALKTPSIRLLSAVLNEDTQDLITALYVDEIDYYIGYMDLYLLSISYKRFGIAKILKEIIIIKNLLMKEALVISFENLIGPSDIPDIIYNNIIK